MASTRLSAQAISEPDGLEVDGRDNESVCRPMHAELCIYCQALAFNERDHFDTLESDGYCLVWNEDGALQFDFGKGPSDYFDNEIDLRIQHERKDSIPNLPSITATAEAGCHICKFLLSRTTERIAELGDTKSTKIAITIKFKYRCASPPFQLLELVADTFFGTVLKYEDSFMVEADRDGPCAQALGIRTNTFLPNWSFDEKVATMQDWIRYCANQYCACHYTRPTTLPTRLLDLSSSQGPNQDIRLIHSKDIPRLADCKYAALSHCWGSPARPPLKTEMDSLGKMLCNIPFASLPANYQDVVRVARGLGMDYLWIDSLCIVQDSLEDWESEASRIIDVYQQAYVTIIAATGNSCHDGFLDPKADQRIKIPYVSSLAGSSIKDTYYLREKYDANHDIRDSPWNQRGWTLQESAFSHRRLFFTQNSFSYAHELELNLMDETTASTPGFENAESLFEQQGTMICTAWLLPMEKYSRRHFTFHQDRLPAISAWAQLMSEMGNDRYQNDRYLAGLWEGSLTYGLLWSCEATLSTQTLAKRLKYTLKENFCAPSWSWASQTQSIRHRWWPWDNTESYQILEIEVSPIGANPFGRFKNGHIVVSGAIRPLPMTPIQRCADFFQSTVDDGYCIEYYMDWWEERMDVTSGQTIERGTVQDVKMLLLAECMSDRRSKGPSCACGLLVLPTGTDEEYWRVGVFCIHHNWAYEELCQSLFDCEWSTIKIV